MIQRKNKTGIGKKEMIGLGLFGFSILGIFCTYFFVIQVYIDDLETVKADNITIEESIDAKKKEYDELKITLKKMEEKEKKKKAQGSKEKDISAYRPEDLLATIAEVEGENAEILSVSTPVLTAHPEYKGIGIAEMNMSFKVEPEDLEDFLQRLENNAQFFDVKNLTITYPKEGETNISKAGETGEDEDTRITGSLKASTYYLYTPPAPEKPPEGDAAATTPEEKK